METMVLCIFQWEVKRQYKSAHIAVQDLNQALHVPFHQFLVGKVHNG